jgi:hypothetical protein
LIETLTSRYKKEKEDAELELKLELSKTRDRLYETSKQLEESEA